MQWWASLKDRSLRERFADCVPVHVPDGVMVRPYMSTQITYTVPRNIPKKLAKYSQDSLLVNGLSYVFRRHIDTITTARMCEINMYITCDGDKLHVYLPVFAADGTSTTASFMTGAEHIDDLRWCTRGVVTTLLRTVSQDIANHIESVDIAGISCAGIDISRLHGLRFAQFRECSLREIPPCLRSMPKLEQIVLSKNHITDLGSLEYWPDILRIDLSSNLIAHIAVPPRTFVNGLPIVKLTNNPIGRYARDHFGVTSEQPDDPSGHTSKLAGAGYRKVHAAADALVISVVQTSSRYCRGYRFPRDILKLLHSHVVGKAWCEEWWNAY